MSESFDYRELLDEFRCRPIEWLRAHREALVREQRRLHTRELAVTAVLDEREAIDDTTAAEDGISAKTLRQRVETARKLESLPEVAAAAHQGELSEEQLVPVAQLADESTDAEWADRAPNCAPEDLAKRARCLRKPSSREYAARHAARALRLRWDDDHQFLHLYGQFAAIQGAIVHDTIDRLVDHMRPAEGEPWASRHQRAADVLVKLCEEHGHGVAEGAEPSAAWWREPLFVVEVPQHGPATIAGIPLPDTVVEHLRASAKAEPVLVDGHGVPMTRGRTFPVLSAKLKRAVLRRDGHCRLLGCDRRHGLQVHHLWPRSWGGTDDIANLTAVCAGGAAHHTQLVPHGPWLPLGNPNRPDGLHLVHRDDVADLEEFIRQRRPPTPDELHDILRTIRGRAGPDAA